jgi:hypothetical protein
MQEEHSQDQKARLAVAIARGKSVSAWARKNDVPERTAFEWASEPEVRKSVELWRRRVLNIALDRLTALAPEAIAQLSGKANSGPVPPRAGRAILALSGKANSGRVQPRAGRAILADRKSDAELARLEARLAAVEEQLRARAESGARYQCPACCPPSTCSTSPVTNPADSR